LTPNTRSLQTEWRTGVRRRSALFWGRRSTPNP